MSRCAITLPAVDRRSPAMMTPPSKSAATIVVPCGRAPCGRVPGGSSRPVPWPGAGAPGCAGTPGCAAAPGSRCGAEPARKSAKDEVPVARQAAVNRSPKLSSPTEILPVGRHWSLPRHYCPAARCAPRRPGNMISLGRNADGSLPALLDIGPDELLGVLLQHLVDLVEDRV